jgi:hypothetical protein
MIGQRPGARFPRRDVFLTRTIERPRQAIGISSDFRAALTTGGGIARQI